METIEERAKKYANERYPLHTAKYNDRYAREHYQKCRDAYIKICEEQKAIDIDKAWEIAQSLYEAGRNGLFSLTKEEFQEAMEE